MHNYNEQYLSKTEMCLIIYSILNQPLMRFYSVRMLPYKAEKTTAQLTRFQKCSSVSKKSSCPGATIFNVHLTVAVDGLEHLENKNNKFRICPSWQKNLFEGAELLWREAGICIDVGGAFYADIEALYSFKSVENGSNMHSSCTPRSVCVCVSCHR